jgi:Glycosyl transferase family 11
LIGKRDEAPTVCVRILGGLGNQMFCAAAGLALAHQLHARLEFDLREYKRDKLRQYELGIFELPASVHEEGPLTLQAFWSRLVRGRLLAGRAPADWTAAVWEQPSFQYDPSFHAIRGSVYISGYFQSPKYFAAIADLVRQSFDFHRHLSPTGRALVEAARGDDTIAVHVRRGDYVTNPKATAVHGVLGASYYSRALDLVTRLVDKPRVFVVTDDEAAARAVLPTWPDGTRFVSGTSHFDDMQLIASCRHRVIANSSFSWWGAWLDGRSDGLTVAPRAWFGRKRMLKVYVDDLYPTGWFLT